MVDRTKNKYLKIDIMFWNYFNAFSILFLLFVGIIIFLLMRFVMKEVLNHTIMFLNSLSTKSLQAQKFYNINNLKKMKKYIGISVLLIVIVGLVASVIVINDSRDYFKDLFEQQRNELNLRSEASVDSLQTIIIKQEKFTDSLIVVRESENKMILEKISILESETKNLKQQNINLNNVIKHQNQMITNLKK